MIWKYALALELTDTGFDYSVLSEFRARLLQGGQEAQLLEALLTLFQEKGWLKARGVQRTDFDPRVGRHPLSPSAGTGGGNLASGVERPGRGSPGLAPGSNSAGMGGSVWRSFWG